MEVSPSGAENDRKHDVPTKVLTFLWGMSYVYLGAQVQKENS